MSLFLPEGGCDYDWNECMDDIEKLKSTLFLALPLSLYFLFLVLTSVSLSSVARWDGLKESKAEQRKEMFLWFCPHPSPLLSSNGLVITRRDSLALIYSSIFFKISEPFFSE